jgi:hypothetical protein
MAHDAPESESWFDEYVRAHGQDPGEAEPDLGIEKNPDRLITWNGHEVVCEIKQFESNRFARLIGGFGVIAMPSLLSSVRRKIRDAGEQLEPLADSGMPLVVVLANPQGQPIAFSTQEIIWALYGDPVIKIPLHVEDGGPGGEAQHTVGLNGRLRFDHQYLSAVVALRHREHAQDWSDENWARIKAENPIDPRDDDAVFELGKLATAAAQEAEARGEIPEGHYFFAEVFTTISETAVPLPQDVFDGPGDTRWDYDRANENYQLTRGEPPRDD